MTLGEAVLHLTADHAAEDPVLADVVCALVADLSLENGVGGAVILGGSLSFIRDFVESV